MVVRFSDKKSRFGFCFDQESHDSLQFCKVNVTLLPDIGSIFYPTVIFARYV